MTTKPSTIDAVSSPALQGKMISLTEDSDDLAYLSTTDGWTKWKSDLDSQRCRSKDMSWSDETDQRKA